MELLLNLMWLTLAAALGGLLLVSRSRCEAASQNCLHTRTTAWICYAVLIALLLPAISMTDDLMAMVVPSDGEQITRRYEACPSGPQHANLHEAILHTSRNGLHTPPVWIENLDPTPALHTICSQLPRHTQDRAPPAIA